MSGQRLTVEVRDARNNAAQTQTLTTDETGCASGEYTLGEEPPLGVWSIRVDGRYPDGWNVAGGLFRVEEYKKPEFEVKVHPAATQARLGDKFRARIEARYLFEEALDSDSALMVRGLLDEIVKSTTPEGGRGAGGRMALGGINAHLAAQPVPDAPDQENDGPSSAAAV